MGVNLGGLYQPLKAGNGAVFAQASNSFDSTSVNESILHVALVKIRMPYLIEDEMLRCVCQTLSQLVKLGLSCVIVVDNDDGQKRDDSDGVREAIEQTNRIVDAFNTHGGGGARRLDNVLDNSPIEQQLRPSTKSNNGIYIKQRNLLLAPLRRGLIPVIAPVMFASDSQKLLPIVANEVILALTHEFAGIQPYSQAEDDPDTIAEKITSLQKQVSIDRVIVLDPLGGIPSVDRIHGSHVFINLEQELDTIQADLENENKTILRLPPEISRPFPQSKSNSIRAIEDSKNLASRISNNKIHLKNLNLLRNTLALLPSSSSGFLTTADAVASSQSRPPIASQGPRVRTRRQRNALIHNLLTDKPVFSSSLPSHRLPNLETYTSSPAVSSSPATFFKRGMPVSIVPDPVDQVWEHPSSSNPSINLSDTRIDIPRLVHLIDDSFSRKLDVPKYLARVKDQIAGVIIAGEYEGGAILTWEKPPGSPAKDLSRLVPYLDKFAVLKRSQGAGGVADIVFKAMVRDCFPNGVCWRSRTDNPVNKWYFERARGSWKMPGTNWTMFWTTKDVEIGSQVFLDYEEVCKTVIPTWADEKGVVD